MRKYSFVFYNFHICCPNNVCEQSVFFSLLFYIWWLWKITLIHYFITVFFCIFFCCFTNVVVEGERYEKKKKKFKWNILTYHPESNNHSLTQSSIEHTTKNIYISRWIFHFFSFYYSGRYKSNTSTLVSCHAWQLIFAEGWVIIHIISFL